MTNPNREHLAGLAHELWSAAQLLPGEGIEDGVARIADLIAQAKAAPQAEPVSREALKKRFDQLELEVMQNKHTAASLFTKMRTAALYLDSPSPDAELVSLLREIITDSGFSNLHEPLQDRIDAKLASLK
jgi:hypothetical protein